MKIIIGGIGVVGRSIAEYLSTEDDKDVIVIDQSSDSVSNLTNSRSIAGVTGDITNISSLSEARIEDVDLLIAATNDNNANIVSALVASNIYNVPYKVVKLDDEMYTKSSKFMNFIKGSSSGSNSYVDEVMNIHEDLSKYFVKNVETFGTNIIDVNYIDPTVDSLITRYRCNKSSLVYKSNLSNLHDKLPSNSKIIGVIRDGKSLVIQDNFDNIQILMHDIVLIISREEDIYNISQFFSTNTVTQQNSSQEKININIIGESRSSYNIALKILSSTRYSVRLIVRDIQLAQDYFEVISALGGEIIHISDIVYDEIRKIHLNKHSRCIVNYHNDYENAMASYILRDCGVEKLICRQYSTYENKILLDHEIYSTYYPSDQILSSIIPYVRRGIIFSAVSSYQLIETIYCMPHKNSRILGMTIGEIHKQFKDITICGVIKANRKFYTLDDNTSVTEQMKIIISYNKDQFENVESMINTL